MNHPKERRLFLILGGFFITNALVAEFIGVKIFSLERTFGFPIQHFKILGITFEGINLSAGVLLWPFVFVLTDIVNEYFGKKGVQLLSWLAVFLILYAFLAVQIAIWVAPAPFWKKNVAFVQTFSQSLWIIIGSLIAFLIGQMVDVIIFHRIRRITQSKHLWLRATGSTLVSQWIDSYVVLFIAFYLGSNWSLQQVLAVGTFNYIYKFFVAIILTPLLYVMHYFIDRYLGVELAQRLMQRAALTS